LPSKASAAIIEAIADEELAFLSTLSPPEGLVLIAVSGSLLVPSPSLSTRLLELFFKYIALLSAIEESE